MKYPRFAASVVGAAVLATAGMIGAGGTASAEGIPRFDVLGQNIYTVGDHASCNGTINVGLESDRAKPGKTFMVLTSPGFSGIGPDWTNNPVCKVTVMAAWFLGGVVSSTPVAFGPGPSAPVVVELPTTSGPTLMMFGTAPQISNRLGTYVWIP